MSRNLIPYRWIYILIDPRNGEIRYVGQTGDLETRFSEHLKNQSSIEMANWVYYDLSLKGLEPIMLGIECVPRVKANAAERRWLQTLSRNHRLLNRNYREVKDG